jgi:hypothetical protein
MGKLLDFKNIENWDEIFDLVRELLTFLVEEDKITPEMITKSTYDTLQNAGYGYKLEDVRRRFYE